MTKILHVPSGVIFESEAFLGQSTLDLVFTDLKKDYKTDVKFRESRDFYALRRFIDSLDDNRIWISGTISYEQDVNKLRTQICKEEFEILYD